MIKTTKVEAIEIMPVEGGDAELIVRKRHTWDDPDDNDAPLHKYVSESLRKYTITLSINPETEAIEEVSSLTDISGEDQLVQDIAAVVWA